MDVSGEDHRAKYHIIKSRLLSKIDGSPLLLTDGGLETTLIYHKHLVLREFASYLALEGANGLDIILAYFREYLDLARSEGKGFVLETLGWRASYDWGAKVGKSREEIDEINRTSVSMMRSLAAEYGSEERLILVSGNLGPRGDGYETTNFMNIHEAEAYHAFQIRLYVECGVDLVTAMTINYVEEALGIVKAAQHANIPVVISFTVETDGRLPSGQLLKAAITEVDLVTDNGPLYYMINCAHPSHFLPAMLDDGAPWVERIRGFRANSSCKSHAELNEMETLDEGDVEGFGKLYGELLHRFPWVRVLGGCCGTDIRHLQAVCRYCK